MLSKYNSRVEQTGEIGKDNFMFRHIAFTEKEMEEMPQKLSLKDIANVLGVDFISITKNENIEFVHITNISYTPISHYGIKAGKHIGDLGNGIYVIDKNDPEAIDNLLSFLSEQYSTDEELTIVTGTYKGEYTECVYGYGHRGYIVLKTDALMPGEIDVDITDIVEFEYRYMG